MFKVKNNIGPEIIKEVFATKVSSYELRDNNSFKRRRVNSVWHGTDNVVLSRSKNMGFST